MQTFQIYLGELAGHRFHTCDGPLPLAKNNWNLFWLLLGSASFLFNLLIYFFFYPLYSINSIRVVHLLNIKLDSQEQMPSLLATLWQTKWSRLPQCSLNFFYLFLYEWLQHWLSRRLTYIYSKRSLIQVFLLYKLFSFSEKLFIYLCLFIKVKDKKKVGWFK